MIKRFLQQKLRQAVKQYPVITMTGPRQSGKTYLLRYALPDYNKSMIKGLKYLTTLAKAYSETGVLLYGGEKSVSYHGINVNSWKNL